MVSMRKEPLYRKENTTARGLHHRFGLNVQPQGLLNQPAQKKNPSLKA
jgi:hypothetical protein